MHINEVKIPTTNPFISLFIELRNRVIGKDVTTGKWIGNITGWRSVELAEGNVLAYPPARPIRQAWLEAGLIVPSRKGSYCLTQKGAEEANQQIRQIQHVYSTLKTRTERTQSQPLV